MLVVREEHTVRALLRAIISAKFSPEVNDQDVPGSPFVAKLAREAVRVLEEAEVQREGPEATRRWADWRNFGARQLEWDAAVKFATQAFATHWSGWTDEQRANVIRDLASPYELSTGDYLRFVREFEGGLQRYAD